MKIEKLPSGTYRVRKMVNGVTHTLMYDHKPTQAEINTDLAGNISKAPVKRFGQKMKFKEAANSYIEIKRNVLSPPTIKAYKSYLRNIPEWFSETDLNDIDNIQIQAMINEWAIDHSPKYCRNINGFISAVCGLYKPDLNISTTLPKKRVVEPYIPSKEEVIKLIKYAQGSNYEIVIPIMMYGVRRSEACCITVDDLSDTDVISITKAKVLTDKSKWVIKNFNKTDKSTREIPIDHTLANKIREKGCVFDGEPSNILQYMYRAEKALGIPRFSPHKLRHYFVSEMAADNVDEETILALAGYSTDFVMKRTYRHLRKEKLEEAKRQSLTKLTEGLYD